MGGGGCLHRHCRHFSGRRALSALSRQGKRRFSYISLSLEWFVTFEFFICSIWRRRTRILCSRLCRRLRKVGIWYLSLSVSGFSDEDVSDLMVGLVQSWCFWGSFPCCWLCSRTWSPNFVCQSMSWVTCCLASFRKKSMPLRVSRTGHLGGICSPLHHHLAAMRSPTLHTFFFFYCLLFIIQAAQIWILGRNSIDGKGLAMAWHCEYSKVLPNLNQIPSQFLSITKSAGPETWDLDRLREWFTFLPNLTVPNKLKSSFMTQKDFRSTVIF